MPAAIDKKLFNVQVGTNIDAFVDGDVIYFRVSTAGPGVMSKSMKSKVLASTNGNKQVGDVTVGINVYRKA
jgi:hypothetical protein